MLIIEFLVSRIFFNSYALFKRTSDDADNNNPRFAPKHQFSLLVFQDPKIVSDRNLAVLVRQVALHCNLAAQIHDSVSRGRDPYASNWLERLRAIKRIREKVAEELSAGNQGDFQHSVASNDFTSAVLRRND